MVDPFEALRAYVKRGGSRPGDISGRTEHNPRRNTDTIRHVAHATTNASEEAYDLALHEFAPRSLRYSFVQELPSSNSPQASRDINNKSTSGSSLNHGQDTEQPQFESCQMNATRYSSDSNNKQLRSHAREFHIQLAAMNLERERGTARVPANMDLDYIRFREELKQKLMRKGDECIWRGLVAQDEWRL